MLILTQVITIIYHSATEENISCEYHTEKSITGVMFSYPPSAIPPTNPLRPLKLLSINFPTASSAPEKPRPTGQSVKVAKMPKKKSPRKIRGAKYAEYISQDYKTLQELSKLQGLPYRGKKWTALLLSLSDQGRLSKTGRFSVHVVGGFDDECMDSEKKVRVLQNLLDFVTKTLLTCL